MASARPEARGLGGFRLDVIMVDVCLPLSFVIKRFLTEQLAQVLARRLRPATSLRPVLSNLSTVGAGLV